MTSPCRYENKRTNADAISGEHRDTMRKINQRERELTFEIGEQLLAMFLIEVNDQLGVGLGAEDMPFGFELRAPLGKIEELAVADDRDAAVLVENRLLAVVDADDAQPAMREFDPRGKRKPQSSGLRWTSAAAMRRIVRRSSPC